MTTPSAGWLAEDAFSAYEKHRGEMEKFRDLNEAATRLRIINTILFDVLKWDKNAAVEVEKYINKVGFVDYICGYDPNFVLVIEAKKTGVDFILPGHDYPEDPVPFALIAKECPGAAEALTQAQGYANQKGVRYSCISNGRQWLMSMTFVPNEPVEQRLVLVFESFDAIARKFRAFYECFSQAGVTANVPSVRLFDSRRAPAPTRLSAHIPGYPVPGDRNQLSSTMRGVLQLVWDEVNLDADNEIFLRHCYINPEPSDDMLRVAKELLEQRVNADEFAGKVEPASAKNLIALQERAEKEHPIVLLGRIGHGKSTFLKYLRHIEAKKLLQNKYIQIDLDFNQHPASADEVPEFILNEVERQLKDTYHIAIWSDGIVRQALKQELKEFHSSPRGQHLNKAGDAGAVALAEIEFMEGITRNRNLYFSRVMRLIRRGHGKSIVIFFDNLDRQNDAFQEQAFLRASAIAADWSALVFVCLRPGTVQRSQARGVLDTIAPRIITISPPGVSIMLRKRFQYAAKFSRNELPVEAYVKAIFSEEINKSLPNAAAFFDMCDQSIHVKERLSQQYEAVANGNIRLIIRYVREMLASNHLNTDRIVERLYEEGYYFLAEHETLRALIFGPFIHFEPNVSLFVNMFDIYRADPTEHFSRLLLLEYCHRHAYSVDKYGFTPLKTLNNYMANLGYTARHVSEVVEVLFAKKCVEGRDYDDETPKLGEELRITSLGSYHVTTLARLFTYLDAVVIDTPILDNSSRRQISDDHDVFLRIERSRIFLRYLDRCSESLSDPDARRVWAEVSSSLANNITDVEASAVIARERDAARAAKPKNSR